MTSAASVEDDFKTSLEDLIQNDRFSINALTLIAKEHTEYAENISNALMEHIKMTRPEYKLPAFYVMDSIAKNVGTPYTLFFSSKLYPTFMTAYASVSPALRKRLAEMLQTWKVPVPGSLDTRPVFSKEITGKIENALLQAQQNFHTKEQELYRQQQAMLNDINGTVKYANRPTPPPQAQTFMAPPANMQQHMIPPQSATPTPHQNYSQYGQSAPFYGGTPFQSIGSAYQPPPVPSVDLPRLATDLEWLIKVNQADFASNPYDSACQARLSALLDLQTIVRQQQLAPEQLQAVRSRVDMLQMQNNNGVQAVAQPPPSSSPPMNILSQPRAQTVAYDTTQTQAQFLTQIRSPTLQNALSHSRPAQALDLKSLLSAAGQGQLRVDSPQPPQQMGQPGSAAPAATLDILSQLKASGLLGLGARSPALGSAKLATTSGVSGQSFLAHLMQGPETEERNGVEMTSAALKIPRAHLVTRLYEAKSNQCSTCGIRFLGTPEGKEKKSKHLDWHFKTNQRILDSTKRGQSRSWYLDEMAWIKSDDDPEGDGTIQTLMKPTEGNVAKEKARNVTIPAPSEGSLSKQPCPICQDFFETKFDADLGEFVWLDAEKFGNRIYHASCRADLKKDGGPRNPRERTATPEMVLGKRKAETVLEPSLTKIKQSV